MPWSNLWPARLVCPARTLAPTNGLAARSGTHRSQIRAHLGFRSQTINDQEKLTAWLATNVAHAECRLERVREELLTQFRMEQIEAPRPGRLRSALRTAEQKWPLRISTRLDPPGKARLVDLINADVEAEVDDSSEEDGTQGSETMLPSGEVKLDMTARLNIRMAPPNDPPTSPIESP